MQLTDSTNTAITNAQAQKAQVGETDSATKSLEDAKKTLTKLMENSSDDATKETLQKAIGNIDKKINPDDENDSVKSSKKTEAAANSGNAVAEVKSTDKSDNTKTAKDSSDNSNKSVTDAKKTLEDILDKTTDSKTKASLKSAIEKIDDYLSPEKDSESADSKKSDKSLNKNVSNAFDKIKETMTSLGEKYGGADDIENSLKKMEKYLNSSDDSDTDKLSKMKDILNDTFDNYASSDLKVDGDFFSAKRAAQNSIDTAVDDATKAVETSSSGVTISDASKDKAANDSSSTSAIAKSSFNPMIPDYMKNVDFNASPEDFYAQLLNGSTGLNIKS